jgi:light-harvesting complex II chlorophyll a/b binding protein 4
MGARTLWTAYLHPIMLSLASIATTALSAPTPATPRQAGWLPGSMAPSYLDGSLVGDVGFDPLCLVALAPTGARVDGPAWAGADRKARMIVATPYEKRRKVAYMREAEIKHARLAMMAAAGWPLSELLDRPLASLLGLPSVLDETAGRAPSVLNGHLFEGPQGAFLLLAALATAALELKTLDNAQGLKPDDWTPGDLGFDPAALAGRREDMALAEIKNGRVAMLAVVGFAIQEAVYGTPVVQQTPAFFMPPFFY